MREPNGNTLYFSIVNRNIETFMEYIWQTDMGKYFCSC